MSNLSAKELVLNAHLVEKAPMPSIYDFEATSITGTLTPLSDYRGRVLLIVNTASRCGFTPQFTGLQVLYDRFEAQGFAVLGFPCNQFRDQDPAPDEAIATFCQVNYGVRFPMFAKVEVNGTNAHPLFQFLKREAPGVLGTEFIKWNFTKFLVSRDGRVVERFAPNVPPEAIAPAIQRLL